MQIIDLTHLQTNPPEAYRKFRRVNNRGRVIRSSQPGGTVVRRTPGDVTGITIHQTACRFGASKALLKQAGGDSDKARHLRALGVACHVLAFDCGHVVHSAPFDWYVYHGNGFNSFQLGLEIEGRYNGLWKRDQVTDDTLRATCAALKYMVEEGRRLDMPIEWIYAHRQSSASRRGDPGEELWKRAVLMYAVSILGLKTDPGMTVGKGRPIPTEWDMDGFKKC